MKINEASKKVDLSIDTIRYYEKIGIIGPVPRKNGIRDFGSRAINQLNFAKIMRKAGVKISKLQMYVKYIYGNNDQTIPKRRKLLLSESKRMQREIDNLVHARDYLNYKVDNYYSHMRKAERSINK